MTLQERNEADKHDPDCFLSGGDDGRFPCICRKNHEDRMRDGEQEQPNEG